MTHTTPARHRRAVQLWLFAVAALMVVTLVVGGATRLTESGLSIVEWKPVTGVLPPMSQEAWQVEFDKYKEIPQYRELNRGMALEAFKTIYWWEWSHRMLARLVGAAFLAPFLFFLWRGWIEPRLKLRLWLLFGGGALLGVGWLVDGLLGSRWARERVAIPARLPFDAGVRDLCCDLVDCIAVVGAHSRACKARDCALRRMALRLRPSCKSISAHWWPASMPA